LEIYDDRALQDEVSRLMAPKALREADDTYLENTVQPVLRRVPADRVAHGALRRIERNGLSVARGLSFKARIVAMSEVRRFGVFRPSWELDTKNTAYRFLDALEVRRPFSDSKARRFDSISAQFPSVIKATRSTGSRGCYLLFDPQHIVHARDNTILTSLEELRDHAHQEMGRTGRRSPSRPLPNRWMVEEMILENSSKLVPARDFKFYCFYGEILLMQESRRLPSLEVAFWNDQNEPTRTGRYEDSEFEGMGINPDHREIVSRISREIPFPFMRIDMLNGGDEIVFGEFTPRPGHFEQFNDYWDRRMGEAWAVAESRITEDLLAGKQFTAFTRATRFREARA
jgi:hypothetical protein